MLPVDLNITEQTSDQEKTQLAQPVTASNKTDVNEFTLSTEYRPKALPLQSNNAFTLQLGVFSTKTAAKTMLSQLENLSSNAYIYQDNSKGKPLFRVFLGNFKDHQQASYYKKASLPQTVNSFVRPLPEQQTENDNMNKSVSLQGYVIQFIAGQNKLKILSSAASITSISEVFFAEKQVEGKVWYCLISQTFINKDNAQKSLDASGLSASAWLVKRTKFDNILALNSK